MLLPDVANKLGEELIKEVISNLNCQHLKQQVRDAASCSRLINTYFVYSFTKENAGRLEIKIRLVLCKNYGAVNYVMSVIYTERVTLSYENDKYILRTWDTTKNDWLHIEVDINGSDITILPYVEAMLYLKTDFGGYKCINSICWDDKLHKLDNFSLKLNDTNNIDKILKYIFNSSGNTREWKENEQSGYANYIKPGLTLMDLCQKLSERKEKKKTRFHDMFPIQTQILEEVKKMLLSISPNIKCKFESKAKSKEERAILSWGFNITSEIDLENGRIGISCPSNCLRTYMRIPEFVDPKFDPDKIIQFAKDAHMKMLNMENTRQEIISLAEKLGE